MEELQLQNKLQPIQHSPESPKATQKTKYFQLQQDCRQLNQLFQDIDTLIKQQSHSMGVIEDFVEIF